MRHLVYQATRLPASSCYQGFVTIFHSELIIMSPSAERGAQFVNQAPIMTGLARPTGESGRASLYKQLSNRKWPDGIRWREREPVAKSGWS